MGDSFTDDFFLPLMRDDDALVEVAGAGEEIDENDAEAKEPAATGEAGPNGFAPAAAVGATVPNGFDEPAADEPNAPKLLVNVRGATVAAVAVAGVVGVNENAGVGLASNENGLVPFSIVGMVLGVNVNGAAVGAAVDAGDDAENENGGAVEEVDDDSPNENTLVAGAVNWTEPAV